VTEELSKNADLLNRTVVFPSTNYPGRTQEGILTQLLRKKLEPQVEKWVEEGRKIAETERGTSKTEDEFLNRATRWLAERFEVFTNEELGQHYTAEEKELGIENVNTGIKGDYEEEDSDKSDDDEKDSEMAVTSARRTSLGQVEYNLGQIKGATGKANSLEEILRFATTGAVVDHFPSGRR
jgi:mediator of RNA polymerase II transcription subunit 8